MNSGKKQLACGLGGPSLDPNYALPVVVEHTVMLLLGMKGSLLLVRRKIATTIKLQESIGKGEDESLCQNAFINCRTFLEASLRSINYSVMISKMESFPSEENKLTSKEWQHITPQDMILVPSTLLERKKEEEEGKKKEKEVKREEKEKEKMEKKKRRKKRRRKKRMEGGGRGGGGAEDYQRFPEL
ncbi:hypothetical protein STEG23_028100 [Scotinomys teguina]